MSMSAQPGILGLELPVYFHDTILPTSPSTPESSWGPYDQDQSIFPNCSYYKPYNVWYGKKSKHFFS